MTGTDLTVTGGVMPSAVEIDTAIRIGTNLAASGMFKDATKAAQAFAKIMLGRDLGLSPTQAMIGLHVVEGKPELSANLQAQLVKTYRGPDGERYDFDVVEVSNEKCTIKFLRRRDGEEWTELGVETYSMKDAQQAGLANKDVWKKHPRNMLWARCMSNGTNFHCPEVARGLRVYAEGEAGEVSDPSGVTPRPQPAAAAEASVAPPVAEEQIPDADVVVGPASPDDVIDDERSTHISLLIHEAIDAGVLDPAELSTIFAAAGVHATALGQALTQLSHAQADQVQGLIEERLPTAADLTETKAS